MLPIRIVAGGRQRARVEFSPRRDSCAALLIGVSVFDLTTYSVEPYRGIRCAGLRLYCGLVRVVLFERHSTPLALISHQQSRRE